MFYFFISVDNVYVDNSTNEYSNLKLAIVTKNECLIDDDEDMETKGMSDCESEDSKSFVSMDFESDKNSKSCI